MTDDLSARLVEFVGALRSKGIPAGPSETVDAAAVAATLGLDHRERLREGLASALVRRGGQRDVFDMTFDVFFPAGVGVSSAAQDASDLGVEDLRDLLTMALAEADLRTMQQIAEIAVELLGEVGGPAGQSGGWSAYQTLDRMRPQTLIAGAEAARGAGQGQGQGQGSGGQGSGGQGAGEGDVTDRLGRDEVRRSVDAFRAMVEAEARRRTAELRGRELVTRHAVRQGAGQVEFLSANARQLAELRAAVQPLARKLATRLSARRRRAHRGRIDMRRTLRRAMGTGGVPLRPVFAPPHPTRPELVLLCDVSGSVAGFSGFTMLLVRALGDQFSKVRVFAFVNTVDEVTDLVHDGGDDPRRRISEEARITKWHTSSDYGESFGDFVADHLDVVGPRTSVLILGDGRNNNQNPRLDALHEIALRAKRTFWLNPEHTSKWGLGDSVAPEYAEVVEMHECRTMDQLERFVSRLLPV
ncbi:hypothetical protein HMPREF0063_10773 [Aeromicrobium marinum DSM 15272]|uniref:VWA domain containing CoxE-like protein n=1 Tax=Aeromicrobium marinum DSM 15272 TaxID=585531 RepID=E2S9Y3_9ACTN|nr:VWA domain-containing protein [Aeromicrobium marinum]EFQ84057.1 hypothetical protein HMPREF0063_10773 [Aeromicrobium marinum DSM 15272]